MKNSPRIDFKDILLVGGFILAALWIILGYNASPTHSPQTPVTSAPSLPPPTAEIPHVEVAPKTREDETTAPIAETETPSISHVKPPAPAISNNKIQAPAAKPTTSIKAVESPISTITGNAPKKLAPVTSQPKVTVTPAVVSAKKTEGEKARVAPPTTPTSTATPKAVTAAPTTTGGGTYFLIAASRPTFEQAQASCDEFKRQGYNPLLLQPIKSKGIPNYRVAIFRDSDRKKVEDISAQMDGKAKGFWIDQR